MIEEDKATSEWAKGSAFTLADCAAAPFLFYADWTHPIAERFAHLRAYRARLLARPSFARAVEEARPFRMSSAMLSPGCTSGIPASAAIVNSAAGLALIFWTGLGIPLATFRWDAAGRRYAPQHG